MTYAVRAIKRRPWVDVVALIGGLRWYWCDLDGQHADEALPAEVPATTHMWGWGPQRWVRLRVDGEYAPGAILTGAGHTGEEWVAATLSPPEPFEATQLRPAGGVPVPDSPDLTVRLRQCVTPIEVTFVELTRT